MYLLLFLQKGFWDNFPAVLCHCRVHLALLLWAPPDQEALLPVSREYPMDLLHRLFNARDTHCHVDPPFLQQSKFLFHRRAFKIACRRAAHHLHLVFDNGSVRLQGLGTVRKNKSMADARECFNGRIFFSFIYSGRR